MPFFEVSENCSFHLYNIGCLSMIYRLKYAKSESNFDADFEHPTCKGKSFKTKLKYHTKKNAYSASSEASGFMLV